jgi:hypothetical protein
MLVKFQRDAVCTIRVSDELNLRSITYIYRYVIRPTWVVSMAVCGAD